jgi:transposase
MTYTEIKVLEGEHPMSGRGLNIPWQEKEGELFQLYRQEQDRHRRARLQALWLLRQGYSLDQVRQWVGFSYRTLQRWIAWYRQGGLAAVLEKTPGHGAPGKRPWLNPTQKDTLLAQARQGDFRTIQDAVFWVETQWGVRYSSKGMYSLFYRPKRPIPRQRRLR